MSPNTDSSAIIIRQAAEEDMPALAASLAPEVSAHQVTQRWSEHCNGHREMLVAELDGQVVGTVSLGGRHYQQPGSLHLFALDVGRYFRRRGIGTALIVAVEEEARQRGLDSVCLEVSVENHRAIRLYERLGYERQGKPFIDQWWRLRDDGSSEMVEALSHIMAKRLQ